ncbi:uncharacterized protein [Patagioenas fasciata]|uniref:uncharacterized protein n=1 Tax=Patagioenas fasciata TaxID=372321 RepID=UPI003A9967A8
MSSLEATRMVHTRTGAQQKDQAAASGAADPVSSPAAGSGEAAQLGQRSLAPAAHRRRRRVPSPRTTCAAPGESGSAPGATTRFSHLPGRASPAGGPAAVRGLPAGGAGGPTAAVRSGAGVGLRPPAGAVAQHPLRRAAALPRLPAATGRRGREGEPSPVRREQGPRADGGVEKLHQFGIGGFLYFSPPSDFAEYLLPPCSHRNETILRVVFCYFFYI